MIVVEAGAWRVAAFVRCLRQPHRQQLLLFGGKFVDDSTIISMAGTAGTSGNKLATTEDEIA